MATVATLAVNVIAQTGGFNRGLDKAQKKAKGFGASIGASLKRIVTPAAIAAAAIAGVAIALMKVNQAMERLDIIAKKAKALGISGQELMEFQHSAELSGVAVDTFTSALQKMQKNIGDAVGGIGLAKDSLALVGLEIGELAKLDASEQFLAIADKISKIENASERAAVATAIFGRAGADLIPMMMQGSDAIRAQMEELKRLQGELSDADFQAIEDANDAWTRMEKVMDGVWNKLAVELAPAFEGLVNTMIKMSDIIGDINDGLEKFGVLGEAILKIQKAFAFVGIFTLLETLALYGQKDKSLAEGAIEAVEAQIEAEKELLAEKLKAAEEIARAQEALEQRGVKLLESLRTPLEMYTDTIDDLNMMLAEGVIGWETYRRAVVKAQDDIKKSDEFAAKEIRVAERQAVGAAIRGQSGTFSIQQKQHRALERIREEEKLQLKQLQKQTVLLQQLNNNVQTVNVVGI